MSVNPYTDFQTFTGLDMLKIDIANTYGLDKLTWKERIDWSTEFLNSSELMQAFILTITSASDPLLFRKAVLAYQKAILGQPIGHNVFMDATASGMQIMAALSNCELTGLATNLVDPTTRYDAYIMASDELARRLPDSPLFASLSKEEIRKLVKKPIDS